MRSQSERILGGVGTRLWTLLRLAGAPMARVALEVYKQATATEFLTEWFDRLNADETERARAFRKLQRARYDMKIRYMGAGTNSLCIVGRCQLTISLFRYFSESILRLHFDSLPMLEQIAWLEIKGDLVWQG
jgi:hypothetical protein